MHWSLNLGEMATVILWCGVAFLAAATLIALWSAYETLKKMRAEAKVELDAKREALQLRYDAAIASDGKNLAPMAPLPGVDLPTAAEAAGKLIEALAKAPAWYAMFIGGYILLALSAGMIKPEPPKLEAQLTGTRPGTVQSTLSRPSSGQMQVATSTTVTTADGVRVISPAPAPASSPGAATPSGN